MGLERWGDTRPFQVILSAEVLSFPASTKRWLSRLKMSLQQPEPWKRELSRISKWCSSHVVGKGWVSVACGWTVHCSSLPGSRIFTSVWGSPRVSGTASGSRLLPGPGSPSESTWHTLLVLSGLLFLCPAHRFFIKQAGKHNLLGHTRDPATQLKCRSLPSCSLPGFLWWQILIFLMTKQVFTRSGRLRIFNPLFPGKYCDTDNPFK